MANLINPYRFAAAGFVPTDFADLEFWFDADDAATITEVGGEVSQWDDKSVNGRNISEGTAAQQPNTSTLGGKNTIFYDGGDVLSVLNITSFDVEPCTWFLVFAPDTISGLRYPVSLNLSALDLYLRQSNDDLQSNHGATAGSPSAPVINNMLAVNTTIAVVVRSQDSTNGVMEIDDGTTGEDTDVGTLKATADDIMIGARTDTGTSGLSGHLMEVGFYSQRLSDGDKTTLMNYLKDKWGL